MLTESNQELVSIIIPTYNRAHRIEETLESVRIQSYSNWECLVVDDGSSDCTDTVVHKFVNRDARFSFFRRPEYKNKGAGSCRNYGAEMSSGNYIMWLDDDDLMDKNKVLYQFQALKGRTKSLATCAWGRFSNSKNYSEKEFSIYKNYNNPKDLLVDYGKKEFFVTHCFMLTKDLLQENRWDEDLTINQDGDFFCRILVHASQVIFVANTRVAYRIAEGNNTSSLKNSKQASDLVKSWKKIQSTIENAGFEAKTYLSTAKDHAYNLLKENYYRNVIFKSCWFFRYQLMRELDKRINAVFK